MEVKFLGRVIDTERIKYRLSKDKLIELKGAAASVLRVRKI